jgi:outer membrane immunogenic protein
MPSATLQTGHSIKEDKRMKRILFASLAVATIAATGPSSAADLSSLYKAPLPAGMNWTGCYVGVSGGGGVQADSFTGKAGVGGFFGGQLGCNYQINQFVAGVEGEGFWSDMRTRSDITVLTPGGASSLSSETTRSFSDVAIRLGYTFTDRTLLYGKLGIVWSNQSYSLVSNAPATITASWTTPGVLLGGDFEYALTNNWIARLESDLLFFDSTDATFNTTGLMPPTRQTVNTMNIITKIGLSYKFW